MMTELLIGITSAVIATGVTTLITAVCTRLPDRTDVWLHRGMNGESDVPE